MTTVEQLLAMEDGELSAAAREYIGYSFDEKGQVLSVLTPEWTFKLLNELPDEIDIQNFSNVSTVDASFRDAWNVFDVRDEARSAHFARAVAIAFVLSRQETGKEQV